jgi:hypothetical protein
MQHGIHAEPSSLDAAEGGFGCIRLYMSVDVSDILIPFHANAKGSMIKIFLPFSKIYIFE